MGSKLFHRGFRLIALVLSASVALALQAAAGSSVWFAPDDDTPDYLALFTTPEAWEVARARVGVLKFPPSKVSTAPPAAINGYPDLVRVDAFRKLKAWGVDIAIEAPAVKEWDCRAAHPLIVTRDYMSNVQQAGASVRFIAMDEPLLSGFNRCGLTLEETAARTAGYVHALQAATSALEIGDIEPYPSIGRDKLEHWVEALQNAGVTLAFLHLDIDLNAVEQNRSSDLTTDLRAMQDFLKQRGIPLGIIFWGGHNPEWSDEAYAAHALDLVQRVRLAIGRPDQAIFQSWVVRASTSCAGRRDCSTEHPGCLPTDPPGCGTHSIPLNLPDRADRGFSHTRLILDALQVLGKP